MNKRKTSSAAPAERTSEEERIRRETIELLHPGLQEMRKCAESLHMEFGEFVAHLDCAVEDEEYWHGMGDNESYRDYDWNKIWVGYELLSGKRVPPSRWGGPRVPFSCAC
jgi:hypothetical protein